MSGLRSSCLAAVTLLCLASAARADVVGPWPWSRHPPRPSRAVIEANQKLIAEGEEPIRVDEPRRGVFRSCGSGMGVGLAGIGVAWGLMWVGNRYAGRITRRGEKPEA